jgi:molecular chaperone Hsp33
MTTSSHHSNSATSPRGQRSPDTLTRHLCESLALRAYTATTLETVRRITSLHGATPNATAAMGRTITATALLSATLKPRSDQSLLLRIEGSGPIREIHVQADARGNIRAYAGNPRPDETGELDAISFSKTIGAGLLTIRKETGRGEPYSGIIHLEAGDVAADVARYLTISEQVPSALIIGLALHNDGGIASSGGILIQTLPDTPETSIARVENAIASMERPLGESLKDGEPIESFLADLFRGETLTDLGSQPLRAACRCSRNLILDILSRISIDDLKDMRVQDDGAEVTCAFCAHRYRFTGEELETLIDSKEGSGKVTGNAIGPEIH